MHIEEFIEDTRLTELGTVDELLNIVKPQNLLSQNYYKLLQINRKYY